MGARQLVVHEALEMTVCALWSYVLSFTPMQIMTSASAAGVEMMTRLAPPFKCAAAPSWAVNNPVDSITMSAPVSCHGISPGSRLSSFSMTLPSIEKPSPSTLISLASVPLTESCLSRNAMVCASPNGSLTATSSTSDSSPRERMARVNARPIRPNPLMPTRVAICVLLKRSRESFASAATTRNLCAARSFRRAGRIGRLRRYGSVVDTNRAESQNRIGDSVAVDGAGSVV